MPELSSHRLARRYRDRVIALGAVAAITWLGMVVTILWDIDKDIPDTVPAGFGFVAVTATLSAVVFHVSGATCRLITNDDETPDDMDSLPRLEPGEAAAIYKLGQRSRPGDAG